MEKQIVDNYAKEEKPLLRITEEELKNKGFELMEDGTEEVPKTWGHRKCLELAIQCIPFTNEKSWHLVKVSVFFENVDSSAEWKYTFLRGVKYIHQVDNMFHGFTDRWLEYI